MVKTNWININHQTNNKWQLSITSGKKRSVTATVGHLFEELKSQANYVLISLYLKRKQTVHIEKLSTECDGKSIVLQVYFSENAILLTENEIQSAYWNYNQGTIFTVHA